MTRSMTRISGRSMTRISDCISGRIPLCAYLVAAIVGVALAGCGGSAPSQPTPPKIATPANGEKNIPVSSSYQPCTHGRRYYYANRHRHACPTPSPTPTPGPGPTPSPRPGPTPPYTPAAGCGVERWAVKTLTDPGANSVKLAPVDSTVAQLVAYPPPINPTDRVAPVETTTYRIRVHLDAFKAEADSDIHVAVHDDSGTMIAELASPSCDQGSVVATQVKAARDAFIAKYGQPGSSYQSIKGDATITGVGFFDRVHGQRGVAPNGIELHPVVSITF